MDSHPWKEYARLQSGLASQTNASRASAIEDAMGSLLDNIEVGEASSTQQVNNLVTNRASKERRRHAIVCKFQADIIPQQPSQESADASLMLDQCAEICGEHDFRLLIMRAQGYTAAELSTANGLKLSTVKTREYRARQKLLAWAA